MTPWRRVTLASVSNKPQYGANAKGSSTPVGPRFVRQTDITQGRVDWSSVPYCALDPSEISKYAVHPGDLLISRLGNGVGNAATVRETNDAVFAGYLVRFQPKAEVAVPEFVGYQLQSSAWRQHVSSFRSGAAQPTLNAQQMGSFSFLLPPVEEQRAISATLGRSTRSSSLAVARRRQPMSCSTRSGAGSTTVPIAAPGAGWRT